MVVEEVSEVGVRCLVVFGVGRLVVVTAVGVAVGVGVGGGWG